jgi:regulator of chromosome condensation
MHSLVLDSNSKVRMRSGVRFLKLRLCQIWSFESNDSLALGRPKTPPEGDPDNLPELLVGREDFRAAAIAASDNLSIALSKKGELRAWGTFNVRLHYFVFLLPPHPSLRPLTACLDSWATRTRL